jgi:flagellar hook-associated protein 1
MATIGSAFDLIASALDADQSALSIVANNVANANTAGYTREVPNWQENAPIEIDGVSYSTGVTETGPTSVRDNVLEQRLDQQQQLASASSARLTALNALQAVFSPDSGSSSSTAGDIGSDITNFFDSFSALEANSTDNAQRQQVLSTASTLAGDISNAAANLNSQRSALDEEASSVSGQVNSLTSSIAQLNLQIQSISPDSDAGTLEDQRDQEISQLSQLVGINQISTADNGLSVTTTSGQLLVSGETSQQLTSGVVGGVTHFFLGGADVTSQLESGGGQLGGGLTARDQDIPNALTALDQLAYSIATTVNAQNNSGTDLDGNEGTGTNASGITGNGTTPLYIFSEPTQVAGTASSMSVAMTDPNQIAAASYGDGTGDNSNAIAMAGMASTTIVQGRTPSDYYSQFVSQLGATVSEIQNENTAQNASVTQLQTQLSSTSSVNLNDEAASLQQFERSYQAASEVFTILNTVMASALNLGVQTAVS